MPHREFRDLGSAQFETAHEPAFIALLEVVGTGASASRATQPIGGP